MSARTFGTFVSEVDKQFRLKTSTYAPVFARTFDRFFADGFGRSMRLFYWP